MSEEIVKIDGDSNNGGGQIVRIAVCLSALYKIPIQIINIRRGLSKSGLREQHLRGVNLIKEMCDAEVTGAYLGSPYLLFKPGVLQHKSDEYVANIKTAGCICLLIQIILPCALFLSKSTTYILKGGTNVPLGPQVEYFKNVFRPFLRRFGADFQLDVIRRGYYPDGGGEVRLHVTPVHHLNGIELLDPGVPVDIKGWSFAAGCVKINEAKQLTRDTTDIIAKELSKLNIPMPPINIITYKEPRNGTVGNGYGINIMCKTTTNCIFGGSGLSARLFVTDPASSAASELINPISTNSCVDLFLKDQMIIFMALAKGHSKVNVGNLPITPHTQRAKEVAETMLFKKGIVFNLRRYMDNSYVLECDGAGYTNNYLN
ncbi:PREDICTED: RNA 3'-terminal phosphate cyclase [Ceratosolen solmsi marchali]|uniref:RNA 3'-terminal phosphate cyclase n=1 Tax=Ceratosolen solmsi marchali TaxID=326594 RepID=A0AAJ7DVV9_9HYME|nr:PREDICTED: RNA 3'-terminal phosphate cyclase [Ceratosolen solmsi marchali]